MILLVTVGSTNFDDLIKVTNESSVLEYLSSLGFKKITYQIGKGCFIPQESEILKIEWFRFTDHLLDHIEASDLVVGHAGAGTILDTLYAKPSKPLIVVMNENLMNNHQKELAEKLAIDGYLKCCTSSTLLETIRNWFADNLTRKEFISLSGNFSPLLESFMGIN